MLSEAKMCIMQFSGLTVGKLMSMMLYS